MHAASVGASGSSRRRPPAVPPDPPAARHKKRRGFARSSGGARRAVLRGVAVKLLDPTLDVVFKMLFADPRNEPLLVSLLNAVLRLPSAIVRVKVLNPELPKELARDRGVTLDTLVELADRTRINVEMECDARRAFGGKRWLFHWARLFSRGLRRGESFDWLAPVVCVVFLAGRTADGRFHSTYEVREIHDHRRLSDAFALHVVELGRLEQALREGESPDLERWARFLRLDHPRELDSLAREAPIMAKAKQALEILSREPSAQQIAELRRDAAMWRRLERAEDRAEGRAEGLRKSIETVCQAFGIELDDARRASLEALDESGLTALLDELCARRAWPGIRS